MKDSVFLYPLWIILGLLILTACVLTIALSDDNDDWSEP